jgi:hypothetical protein
MVASSSLLAGRFPEEEKEAEAAPARSAKADEGEYAE